jgi:hypothetical protein
VKTLITELILQFGENIIICLEDVFPKVEKLNFIIRQGNQITLTDSNFPLENYLGNRYHNSAEFLDFINTLQNLSAYSDVRIIGIDPLLAPTNKYDLKQKFGYDLNTISQLYPSLKTYNSDYSNFITNNIQLMATPGKFMGEFISFISESNPKHKIIYLGHSLHVQKKSLGNFHSAGFYLDKLYKKHYVAIGTASAGGKLRYDGQLKPIFKLYRQPKIFNFEDKGTLSRYVGNKRKKNYLIYKVNNSSMFYFTSRWFKLQNKKSADYFNTKHLDYIIFITNSLPSTNIVLTY